MSASAGVLDWTNPLTTEWSTLAFEQLLGAGNEGNSIPSGNVDNPSSPGASGSRSRISVERECENVREVPSVPPLSPAGGWGARTGIPDAPSLTSPGVTQATAALLMMLDDLIKEALQNYYLRFHPIRPITNQTSVLSRLAKQEHMQSPSFAALILSLSALALVTKSGNNQKASWMMEQAMTLHNSLDLGSDISLDTLATSMSISAFLGATKGRDVGYYRLRESCTLAQLLRLDHPSTYEALSMADRQVATTCFWLLVLAERSHALFQPTIVIFRSRPTDIALSHSSSLSEFNQKLRPMVRLYDIVDSEFIECINSQCTGRCRLDIVRAVAAQQALDMVDPAGGCSDVQLAIFEISRLWLKMKLWQACLGHNIIAPSPQYEEMGPNYVLKIHARLSDAVESLPSLALEGNGQAIVSLS